MPRYDESVKLAASVLLAIGVTSITLVHRLEAGDAVPVASADEAFQSALASQKLAEGTAQAAESAGCFQKALPVARSSESRVRASLPLFDGVAVWRGEGLPASPTRRGL